MPKGTKCPKWTKCPMGQNVQAKFEFDTFPNSKPLIFTLKSINVLVSIN